MKKLLATLITLSFVGGAFAATTYTESVVNKWTAPIAQKEQQLQAKKAAAEKAQKERQEAQKKKQEEYKKQQEAQKKQIEQAKKAHQQKMEQKKKDFQNLLKY